MSEFAPALMAALLLIEADVAAGDSGLDPDLIPEAIRAAGSLEALVMALSFNTAAVLKRLAGDREWPLDDVVKEHRELLELTLLDMDVDPGMS